MVVVGGSPGGGGESEGVGKSAMAEKSMRRRVAQRPAAVLDERMLTETLSAPALKFVAGACAGDLEACGSLITAARNAERGRIVRFLYDRGINSNAFREALSAAWELDHAEVFKSAGTWRRFISMFRYAAFALPNDLPDPVTIWRGTCGLPFDNASFGPSWTLKRDAACWFAMREADHFGMPLVLRMSVPKRALIFYSNQRSEAEVIPVRIEQAMVEGTENDWREGFERHEAAIQAANQARLGKLADRGP